MATASLPHTMIGAFVLAACGCFTPPSLGARAQEVAGEMNSHTRFGRMEIAVDSVLPEKRDAFVKRRRAWGNRVRIADIELAGVRIQGEKDADVMVRVAWYRVDEQELRTTTLEQRWKTLRGEWKLSDERRADGDLGLIGEQVFVERPADTGPVQFKTVHIGGGYENRD
jgi:hypothetical protein